jgi:hypothetical protein
MNKVDKPLAKLTKIKKKTQISKFRDDTGVITTDTDEIQKIIWEYFENLYSIKLKNQEDIDKFLATYDPPNLNQEYINNLSRSITNNEIDTVIKNFPTKKSSGLHSWGYTQKTVTPEAPAHPCLLRHYSQ